MVPAAGRSERRRQLRAALSVRSRRRPRTLVALLGLLVFVVTPGSARGQTDQGPDVTRAEFDALVAEARTDPAGVEHLRGVVRVDGRTVDLDVALGDATGADLGARLDQLSAGGGGGGAGPIGDPGADAERILEGDRYQPSRAPQPFRGALQWLADRLEPIGRAITWVFDDPVRAVVASVFVVGLGVIVAARLIGGRNRSEVERFQQARRQHHGVDAHALDRAAEVAEQDGDLDEALRLRFVAGLARLDEAKVPVRTAAPSADLAARLASPAFDELADDFDQVVYGGRAASAGELDRARREWPVVVQEAGR